MKNILYISYTGMTEPLGRSQVLAYLSQLAQRGKYHFTIISFEKPGFFEKHNVEIKDFCTQHQIEWHPLAYRNKPFLIGAYRCIVAAKKLIGQLIIERNFELVHCRSYRAAQLGLWMKKKYGTKFIFDMRGFWADERVDGGLWRLKNPVYRIIYDYFKRMEKRFLENADYTISLTQNAREIIHSWPLQNNPIPIAVIPCCVDLQLFNPDTISTDEKSRLRKELNIIEETKVVTYLGSLGTWYMLDEMMIFYKQWRLKYPQSLFLLVTNEPAAMIFDAAKKAGIEESMIRVTKALRKEVPFYLSISTVSLFFIKPVFSKKASSPVKQGEIMAMGIPVICNSNVGDTDFVINKYLSGALVPDPNEKNFDSFLNQFDLSVYDKDHIRAGASDFYSLESGVEKYAGVYDEVLT